MREGSNLSDDDVIDLLRGDVTMPADAKRRIASRLASSLAMLPDVDPEAPSSAGEAEPSTLPRARGEERPRFDAPTEVARENLDVSGIAVRQAGSGTSRAWLRVLVERPLAVTLTTFSLGAVCGAGIHARIERVTQQHAAPIATSHRTTSADTPVISDGTTTPAELDVAPPQESVVPSPVAISPRTPRVEGSSGRARPTGSGRAGGLAAQQALLDEARAALARDDESAALRAVELHARRYPDSVMSEEREALAIKALIGNGRYVEAKVRAQRFRERFEGSLLRPSIDEMLQAIP